MPLSRSPSRISISCPSTMTVPIAVYFRSVAISCSQSRRDWGSSRPHGLATVATKHLSHVHARRSRPAPAVFPGTLPGWCADVLFELVAELADRVLDRPGGAVGQTADRRARNDADRVADFQQQLEILQSTAPGANSVRASAAPRRCLRGTACTGRSSRGRRTGNCCAGSRPSTPSRPSPRRPRCPGRGSRTCAGSVKSSGSRIRRSREQAHADAAGNGRLGLPSLPDAAAEIRRSTRGRSCPAALRSSRARSTCPLRQYSFGP